MKVRSSPGRITLISPRIERPRHSPRLVFISSGKLSPRWSDRNTPRDLTPCSPAGFPPTTVRAPRFPSTSFPRTDQPRALDSFIELTAIEAVAVSYTHLT